MEKIIIIGAVAAGTSEGAKARRNNENIDITIYEKDNFISYSGCGMPYFIGGEIETIDSLTPRDPAFFKKKYNIDVKTGYEVLYIDSKNKVVVVKNLDTEEEFTDSYDKLILATGATPFRPNIQGINKENVFFLRNIKDAIKIKDFLTNNTPKSAVIAGTGFIGFEILENLLNLGIDVTIVEVADKITPNLDTDMATYLESSLIGKGVKILKSTAISSIGKNKVVLSNDSEINADLVILSTGVRYTYHI